MLADELAGAAALAADMHERDAWLARSMVLELSPTERKVLVLAVLSKDAKPWRPVADDDRYVNNALKKTNRYQGDVVVKRVAFDNLSTYGPLVNDLDVGQSPSIVVIDRER